MQLELDVAVLQAAVSKLREDKLTEAVDDFVRYQSNELAFSHAVAGLLIRAGISAEGAAGLRESLLPALNAATIPQLNDPAMSDHIASEVGRAAEETLLRIEKMVADHWRAVGRTAP
jgi:hypothetical protein